MTLSVEAVPSLPVCRTFLPMAISSGNMASNTGRSQPTSMAILPVAARWQPPDTGQSTALAPVASTSPPRRCVQKLLRAKRRRTTQKIKPATSIRATETRSAPTITRKTSFRNALTVSFRPTCTARIQFHIIGNSVRVKDLYGKVTDAHLASARVRVRSDALLD